MVSIGRPFGKKVPEILRSPAASFPAGPLPAHEGVLWAGLALLPALGYLLTATVTQVYDEDVANLPLFVPFLDTVELAGAGRTQRALRFADAEQLQYL